MNINYFWSVLTVICLFFINGCHDMSNINNSLDAHEGETAQYSKSDSYESIEYDSFNTYVDSSEEEKLAYQQMYLMGQKLKALEEDETLDEIVITVNGRPILKKDIEAYKIFVDSNFDSLTLEERINSSIRNNVLEAEAERLGIKGSQSEVDEYVESVKEAYEDHFPGPIKGYIDGMGISLDEYYSSSAKLVYNSTIRNNLWLNYKAENETVFQNEAEKRNIPVKDVEEEYREKYEAELIEKADIQILDPEIKKSWNSKKTQEDESHLRSHMAHPHLASGFLDSLKGPHRRPFLRVCFYKIFPLDSTTRR